MTLQSDIYVIELEKITKDDIYSVGSKAANLGELKKHGFPVPQGFVVTVVAFDAFLRENKIDTTSDEKEVEKAEIPSKVVDSLESIVEGAESQSFAVRSSGIAEDLAGASYAGQYETVLNVQGTENLLNALRCCWASAFNNRVKQYQGSQHQNGIPKMAVLVQEMVDAEAAGVAFTANPVSGQRDEIVISAVRGLGERLVSGEASPDEWLIKNSQVTCVRDPEKTINEMQVREIGQLAASIQSYFNKPQDVEWAISGGKLSVLQARPITTLDEWIDIQYPTEGFWMKDQAHFPLPVTPFGESVYLRALENGMASMIEEFGVPINSIINRTFGGEVYIRVIPFGGKEGTPPPSFVIFLATRLLPVFRKLRKTAKNVFDNRLPEQIIERWYTEWRDEFKKNIDTLLNNNLAELSDNQLLDHLSKVIALLRRGQVIHFRLRAPYVFALYDWVTVCRELLGWDDFQALSVISGDSAMSSTPGKRLAEIAGKIIQSPTVEKILSEGGQDILVRLREEEPSIADDFESYLKEYGNRPTNYDAGSPTIAERPQFLAKLLLDLSRSRPAAGEDEQTKTEQSTLDQAREILRDYTQDKFDRFEKALSFAQRAYPVREDDVFYTDNVPCGLARYAAIEIGRRLKKKGILDDEEDAVYLTDIEMSDALRNSESDYRSVVTKRKAEIAWVKQHPGPATIGKESPIPSPSAMPEEIRRVTEAYLWYQDLEAKPYENDEDAILSGASASSGVYIGKVRVIHDESEFSKLSAGEVLVCPITTPSWSVLFAHVGAVVTDGGGVLSHAAIIAREYGIPAVLGTGQATQVLKDGQMITVDGTAGKIYES